MFPECKLVFSHQYHYNTARMLTMLSWASAPHPFGKKTLVKSKQVGPPVEHRSMKVLITKALQNFGSSAPRNIAVQTYTHTTPAYSYSVSGSYVLDSIRPSYSHAGQPVATPATPYSHSSSQSYGQTQAPPLAPERSSSIPHHGVANSSPSDGRRAFKIYPSTRDPLAFIYERSEDARSETMTSYSSSIADSASIYSSTTATSSTISQGDYGRDPRWAPPSTFAGPSRDDARQQSPILPQTPHHQPLSLPPSSNSSMILRNNSTLRTGEAPAGYSSPPGRGTDPSRRRGSGSSDSDDATSRSSRPNVLRKSPPKPDGVVQFPTQSPRDGYSSDTHDMRAGFQRLASGSATPGPSREAPTLHRDDSYIETQRSRRMSGVTLPAGGRERTSPVEVSDYEFRTPNSTAVVLRNTPSRDRSYYSSPESTRDRISPDRERISAEPIRERRLSNAAAPDTPTYFDRPMLGRNTSSASSRGRPGLPDEPQRVQVSKPVPIRARTLSISASREPPNVIIAGVDSVAQSRTVRFSENLICPSPVPMDKRRRGWFNKRG